MTEPIRVGVADSGINPHHSHVGPVAGGVGLRFADGRLALDDAWQDLLGHGTAAAATIRGHAPSAELYSIRIFRRRLEAHVEALVGAIDWAASERLDLLNLSLGCGDPEREAELIQVCDRAAEAGLIIVAASELAGRPSWPGALTGVIAVRSDEDLDAEEIRYEDGVFVASPWARPLGELPRERNFKGVSLAVAHVTGIAASRLGGGVRKTDLMAALAARADL